VKSEKISLVTIEAIREAAARIAGVAVKTPLVRAPFPGLAGYGFQKEIRLKAESLQPIGAFKMRGAANKILQLTPDEIARGVITYSSGNHAQAVAYAAREVGAKAVIVMPSNAPAIKRAGTLALGAEVVDVGVASSERLAMAEKLVREHGYVVIPPYDDEQIIAGQATCGLEIAEEWPEVELVLAPVSGAGRRHGGELPDRENRDLGRGAYQPHHCRRPAHAERGCAEFCSHSGVRGRHYYRDRSRDSRRDADDRRHHASGSRAQRRCAGGRAAVPRRPVAGLPKGCGRGERRQCGPGAAG
jgi:hypothetical protein